VLRRALATVRVPGSDGHVLLQRAVFDTASASWLPPRDASLACAVCLVLRWQQSWDRSGGGESSVRRRIQQRQLLLHCRNSFAIHRPDILIAAVSPLQ
jgi:hypothetical protein